jgi:hypothetical protein
MAKSPREQSTEELLERLSDPDRFWRWMAVQTLISRAPLDAQVWPGVRSVKNDPCYGVRLEVLCATFLIKLPDEEAIPLLRQYVADEEPLVRAYAEWALECRSPGVKARTEEEFLKEFLGYGNDSYRNQTRHEPWDKEWVTSKELFTTIQKLMPHFGTQIHEIKGEKSLPSIAKEVVELKFGYPRMRSSSLTLLCWNP